MTTNAVRRTTALILALAVALLGSTSCGGEDDGASVASASRGAGGADPREPSAERYAECLRDEGITLLADRSDEGLPLADKEQTTAEDLAAGLDRCRALHPRIDEPERVTAEDLERSRRHAACVREHGVPAYPDPNARTGMPDGDGTLGRLKADPAFRAALEACRDLRSGNPPTGG